MIIIVIIVVIVVVVVVLDDDTYILGSLVPRPSSSSLLQSAMVCYSKVRQLFYYKVRQVLLQSATGITKCDRTPFLRLVAAEVQI